MGNWLLEKSEVITFVVVLFLIFLGCRFQGEGQDKNSLSVGSIIYFKIILDRDSGRGLW
jgi:hypothetical protein